MDKNGAEVVKYNPFISELIVIDKRGYHNKLRNLFALIKELRNRKFDLVINLHPSERATAMAAFSGAKQVVGFYSPGFSWFFDLPIKRQDNIHRVDDNLRILNVMGLGQFNNRDLEMWVDDESRKSAYQKWLQAFSQYHGPVIGLNTGGSWPTKRWTKEGFANLADKLLAKGYGVAFFGGPMDKPDVETIVGMMNNQKSERLAVFTGKTTLLELAVLVKKCAVFVTGDSGPMHVAVSQNVHVVALFGPSDPIHCAPYSQEDAVITNSSLKCLGCGQHECKMGHLCMAGINVDVLYAKISQKLNKLKP